jgi:hypothetical protein
MVCIECEKTLSGHESGICMDCSNREMVEDKDYTKNKIRDMKAMGYTKTEILDAIKNDKYIKINEIEFN